MLHAPAKPHLDTRLDTTWSEGPADPALGRGVVHVWSVELDRAHAPRRFLSPAERARARQILDPARGELWASGRAALRSLLGAYLEHDPADLALASTRRGKPYLPGGPFFNLSHSGPIALVALAHDGPVGVDVEVERPHGRIDLGAWVRHEAALKCSGVGLWHGPTPGPPPWIADLPAPGRGLAALACARAPRQVRCFRG